MCARSGNVRPAAVAGGDVGGGTLRRTFPRQDAEPVLAAVARLNDYSCDEAFADGPIRARVKVFRN